MEIHEKDIQFTSRPSSVPFQYRTSYKLGLISLIIRNCSSRNSCSNLKLQLICTSYMTREQQDELIEILDLRKAPTISRLDPAVDRAIDFGIADGLFEISSNGKIMLSTIGMMLANNIIEDEKLFNDEKAFLMRIGKKLTEDAIERMKKSWGK